MQFFPLYAIAGDGVNLLGRNWLSEVKLDWAILFHRCKEELNNAVKSLNSGHVRVLKNCPLLRGASYWEVILKRLTHLGLNIFSAILGMSAIYDVRYLEVSLYFQNRWHQ